MCFFQESVLLSNFALYLACSSIMTRRLFQLLAHTEERSNTALLHTGIAIAAAFGFAATSGFGSDLRLGMALFGYRLAFLAGMMVVFYFGLVLVQIRTMCQRAV